MVPLRSRDMTIFYLKDNFGTGEDIRAFSGDKITSYQTLITGSSISEMTNALAVKASVNGKYGNFKGEAEASFGTEHTKSTNYEYASTYYNLEVSEVSFKKDVVARADEFLTDDAWNDINGIPRKNAKTGTFKLTVSGAPTNTQVTSFNVPLTVTVSTTQS